MLELPLEFQHQTLCATADRHLTSQGRPQPKQPESGPATGTRSILLCQSLCHCWPESPRVLLLAGRQRCRLANILPVQMLFCSCLRSNTPLSIGTSICRCGLAAIAAGQHGKCENACPHDSRHERPKRKPSCQVSSAVQRHKECPSHAYLGAHCRSSCAAPEPAAWARRGAQSSRGRKEGAARQGCKVMC